MAAPDLRLRTPTGTGANRSTKSANGSRASRRGKNKNLSLEGKARESLRRLPLVGDDHYGQDEQRKMLTWSGPLMEAATGGSGQLAIVNKLLYSAARWFSQY